MTASPRCSEHLPRAVAGLITLEGMPGAGKTTAALSLADLGKAVVGEYTDDRAATIPVRGHPAVSDDAAHQMNWLRKAAQCATALAAAGTVYADRDWLSSLSYAYSAAAPRGPSPACALGSCCCRTAV